MISPQDLKQKARKRAHRKHMEEFKRTAGSRPDDATMGGAVLTPGSPAHRDALHTGVAKRYAFRPMPKGDGTFLTSEPKQHHTVRGREVGIGRQS